MRKNGEVGSGPGCCVLVGMRQFRRRIARAYAKENTKATGDYGSHAIRFEKRRRIVKELTAHLRFDP